MPSVFKSAMRMSMTYGTLPPKEAFEQVFTEECPDGVYEIRNCRELDAVYDGGNVDFDCEGLWDFLESAVESFDGNHEATDLASSILYTLGFEWV